MCVQRVTVELKKCQLCMRGREEMDCLSINLPFPLLETLVLNARGGFTLGSAYRVLTYHRQKLRNSWRAVEDELIVFPLNSAEAAAVFTPESEMRECWREWGEWAQGELRDWRTSLRRSPAVPQQLV